METVETAEGLQAPERAPKIPSRPWGDLPGSQRAAVIAAAAIEVGMAAAAWCDLARRPASMVRGAKWPWALLIAVNFAGPAAYFRLGRRPR